MHPTCKPSRPPSLRRTPRPAPALWGNSIPDASISIGLVISAIVGAGVLGCLASHIDIPDPVWAVIGLCVTILWYAYSQYKKRGSR